MVKQQISNLRSRVRFSYPAPVSLWCLTVAHGVANAKVPVRIRIDSPVLWGMGRVPGFALQADSLVGSSPTFSTNLSRDSEAVKQ